MASDPVNDRISIKNILFTKAMPNYKIPVPTDGYKIFSCTDCSDKFLFESSYQVHINRKSLQITYICRYCNRLNIFYNRCQFLSHIRSHVNKTATINLGDLKVEPLLCPNLDTSLSTRAVADVVSSTALVDNTAEKRNNICFECKINITISGSLEKDRVKHYMQQLSKIFSCPVCLFTLPSSCALTAHIRLHLKSPPFICPECGMQLGKNSCFYPFSHDCEGFKMMRVTARIKCFKNECPLLHPNSYISHMRHCHFNKIYKCPSCYLAGYNENAVLKHVMRCCDKTNYPTYYECQQCPGILLSNNQITKHLDMHFSSISKNIQLYPCWNCGVIYNAVHDLLKHHIEKHRSLRNNKHISTIVDKIQLKTCVECSKTMYKWSCANSENEPWTCPYCSLKVTTTVDLPRTSQQRSTQIQIVCHLCKVKVNETWGAIKAHFKEFHKEIKCLDVKVNLKRIPIKSNNNKMKKQMKLSKVVKHKNLKKKGMVKINLDQAKQTVSASVNENIANTCKKCSYHSENMQDFQAHILSHREPSMAYQCMECGQCFAVKPSFSTHLLIEHKINNVDDYVNKTDCFNKDALEKHHVNDSEDNRPLERNQCNICREKFNDFNSLEKHYRVHGMAFLKKNTQKSHSP